MDWARAKTILIIVFVLLNIFLLSTILYTNTNIGFQSEYMRYAKEYLDSRNIKIDTKIPTLTRKAGWISYSTKEYDLEKLSLLVFGHKAMQSNDSGVFDYSAGAERITLEDDHLTIKDLLPDGKELFNDSAKLSDRIYTYLKDIGYTKKFLSLQSFDETENTKRLTFMLKYGKAILFEQIITIDLDKDGILSLSITTKEAKRANEPKEILSAYQILVMGNLPIGAHIKNVEFGYKQTSEGDLFDSPVWRVKLGDGTSVFYNSYTGEKLQ